MFGNGACFSFELGDQVAGVACGYLTAARFFDASHRTRQGESVCVWRRIFKRGDAFCGIAAARARREALARGELVHERSELCYERSDLGGCYV